MNSKRYLLICAAAMIIGCTDEKPAPDPGGECNPPCGADQTCVNGACVPNTPAAECDPPCGADQTCVNGACVPNTPAAECDPPCSADQKCVNGACVPNTPAAECDPPCSSSETCVNGICESLCKPACDPVRQTCDPESKTCLYIDNYCSPGSCAPDNPRRVCPADGENAGIWSECAEGESCFHGTCLPEIPTECTEETCNDLNQACIGGEWKQCSEAETCVNGQCKLNTTQCTPGQCIEGDDSYICNDGGTPEKCENGRICIDGACTDDSGAQNKLLWTICSVNSDCSFGTCVKELSMSRETSDPENPGTMIGTVPVSRLDSRIPKGSGICTADCTKDASICSMLQFGEKHFTCQLAFEGISPYPPIDENGAAIELPFAKELDTGEMTKRIPFAAMCRPFIKGNEYPEDFGKKCDEISKCAGNTTCIDGFCHAPCTDDASCPLTFSCVDDPELGKFCKPNKGTFAACRDHDNDGYGVGHCPKKAVDCDDSASGTYYNTDAPKVCSESDTNCNGRIDRHELLGSSENCNACDDPCKTPGSKFHVSRVCYKDNGDRDLDDYTPDTYQFQCLETCAPGFANCDGNINNGCEVNIIEKSKTDDTVKIYGLDSDKDGFGSMRNGMKTVDGEAVYDKNIDERAFCCAGNSGRCYGYAKSGNPSIIEKQWVEIDVASGYSEKRTDCNDNHAATNPDALEKCDGFDNDCDGEIDEFKKLYTDIGEEVDTESTCQTGKGGICSDGKMRCMQTDGVYEIKCKSDRSAELYEYCNVRHESEDCDDEIDNGVIALDSQFKPILDPGKGYRMLSPGQKGYEASYQHICKVDDPDAKGKCMYGKYACDGKTGSAYCRPFAPDPVDFIGDNYDANCDGFDGDLAHTLFVAGGKRHIDGINQASDAISETEIKAYSAEGALHKYPLSTLKKAASFVKDADKFNVTVWYHINADKSVSWYDDQAACDAVHTDNSCKKLISSWDIILASGDVIDQDHDINLASAVPTVENITIPKVIDNGTPVIKYEPMIPAAVKNAWFRIYGSADFIGGRWTMDGSTTTLKFTFDSPEPFYDPSGIVAMFNMASTSGKEIGSAYLKDFNIAAESHALVDGALSKAENSSNAQKSPATMIGINAVNALALTLDNVHIKLAAPSGKDGDPGLDGALAPDTDLSILKGTKGDLLVSDANNDLYDEIVQLYENPGYRLGDNSFEYMYGNETPAGAHPVCSDGSKVKMGRMGGYVRVDEYDDIKNQGSHISVNIQKRLFRNFIGLPIIVKGKTNAMEYRNSLNYVFRRLWGIDYENNKGTIAPDLKLKWAPEKIRKYTEHVGNYDYTNFAPCSGMNRELDRFKAENLCPNYGSEQKIYSCKDYIDNQNIDVGFTDALCGQDDSYMRVLKWKPGAVSYNNRLLDHTYEYNKWTQHYFVEGEERPVVPPASASSSSGYTETEPLSLIRQSSGYRFINSIRADSTDGGSGPNGVGGAGVPAFVLPSEAYSLRPYLWVRNGRSDVQKLLEAYQKGPKDNGGNGDYITLYREQIDANSSYIGGGSGENKYFEGYSNLFYARMIGLYDTFVLNHLSQHPVPGKTISNNKIIYLLGAGGGAGGCGGHGGGGGRPGASAIGIVYAPYSASAKTQLDIDPNILFEIKAGNGGVGQNGGNGSDGFAGGTAYKLEPTSMKDYENFVTIKAETFDGYEGIGGGGGGAGAGAKGGYALGIVLDCSAVNADNYDLCMEKISVRRPDYNHITTSPGIHGFAKDSAPQASTETDTAKGGIGGKAAPAGKGVEREIINKATGIDRVFSDHPVAIIYSVDEKSGVASLSPIIN